MITLVLKNQPTPDLMGSLLRLGAVCQGDRHYQVPTSSYEVETFLKERAIEYSHLGDDHEDTTSRKRRRQLPKAPVLERCE